MLDDLLNSDSHTTCRGVSTLSLNFFSSHSAEKVSLSGGPSVDTSYGPYRAKQLLCVSIVTQLNLLIPVRLYLYTLHCTRRGPFIQATNFNLHFTHCLCVHLKVHKHEILLNTFFAETETIWSQGPVTRDF